MRLKKSSCFGTEIAATLRVAGALQKRYFVKSFTIIFPYRSAANRT
jgi:hypothetical protein